MKQIITLLFATLPFISFSQNTSDPREFNHGTCIVKYLDNNNNKYYLTWSSSYPGGWEHNIYNSKIYFDTNGNLVTQTPDQVFINDNEAQEPVNSVINHNNNYMLSVWEDGSGTDAPNVKGRINLPGAVNAIKENWTIAGGNGSQHSAYTSHLSNRFLIFYADEQAPTGVTLAGAVVKAKVINDITGGDPQTINLTPNDEDNWWPVSVSNSDNTRTLVVWGDGNSVKGTVLLEDNSGNIQMTNPQQVYLPNTKQYHYQVTWLDYISKFLLIAGDKTDDNKSKICLIDPSGNITNSTLVNGGILREAKMVAKWSANHQSYSIFYPSGANSLTQIFIDNTGTISSTSNQITNLPELSNIQWPSTGIWAEFVEDNNGNALFGNDYIALFIMNDTNSNDIVKIPIRLNTGLFNSLSLIDVNKTNFQIYPNPCKNSIYFSDEYLGLDYIIYSTNGKVITKNTVTNNTIDLSFLENGNYLIYFKTKTFKITKIN